MLALFYFLGNRRSNHFGGIQQRNRRHHPRQISFGIIKLNLAFFLVLLKDNKVPNIHTKEISKSNFKREKMVTMTVMKSVLLSDIQMRKCETGLKLTKVTSEECKKNILFLSKKITKNGKK